MSTKAFDNDTLTQTRAYDWYDSIIDDILKITEEVVFNQKVSSFQIC